MFTLITYRLLLHCLYFPVFVYHRYKVEKPENGESEDDLSSILPTDVYHGGLPSYFKHIAELFEERHLADHAVSFCRMALDAIALDVQVSYVIQSDF